MLILDLVDLGIDLFFYAQMQLIQPGLYNFLLRFHRI